MTPRTSRRSRTRSSSRSRSSSRCSRRSGSRSSGADHYEADDVIGTLATDAGMPVDIVTGDRDLFQLVDDEAEVRVLYTARGVGKHERVDNDVGARAVRRRRRPVRRLRHPARRLLRRAPRRRGRGRQDGGRAAQPVRRPRRDHRGGPGPRRRHGPGPRGKIKAAAGLPRGGARRSSRSPATSTSAHRT